ncbi:MAG TPA: ATP-binding cassette domain-containing protein [Stellaceae bacterium]|nr:ATP-binding cassette domain-containing protein [Stellaceae bacterium]
MPDGLASFRPLRRSAAQPPADQAPAPAPVAPPIARPAPQPPASWFRGTVRRLWPIYARVGLATLITNVLALAIPLLAMNVYDRILPSVGTKAFGPSLRLLAIGAVLAVLLDFFNRCLRGWFIDHACQRLDLSIARRLVERVLGMRRGRHPASSAVLAAELRELDTVRDLAASATLGTLVDLPFAVVFLVVIGLVAGPVVAAPAILLPLGLVLGLLARKPIRRLIERRHRTAMLSQGLLTEAIAGLETIRGFGAEAAVRRQWEALATRNARSAAMLRSVVALATNGAGLAGDLAAIGVLVLGAYRVADGRLTIGALVAVVILTRRIMAPLHAAAATLGRVQQARAALRRLDSILQQPPELPTQCLTEQPRPNPAGFRRAEIAGGIILEGVSVAYPGETELVLRDISLTIEPGERVAILGPAGSGKTTLARLLVGSQQPQSGRVLVDGVDRARLDPDDLSRAVAYAPQDGFLFQGTVRDNILFADPTADAGRLSRAARLAGLDDFLGDHRQGYDRMVGERGERLSDSQRRAVVLARALLRPSAVLVLDDPAGALDEVAQYRLRRRLAAMLGDRSLILLGSRPALLPLVDRVIVLEAGRIVADGPRSRVGWPLAMAAN